MVQDHFLNHFLRLPSCKVRNNQVTDAVSTQQPLRPSRRGIMRTYYLEITTRCTSQVLKLHFSRPQLKPCWLSPTQLYFPSITNLSYKCIHYQARRRGVIFLLWSSSRIHQPHTRIYLQIIGKAKMFNCMYKVVVICLNAPLKNVDSWASVGKRGVCITILHDFINRRSLH